MAKRSGGTDYNAARANLSTRAIAERGAQLRANAPMIGGGAVGNRDELLRGNNAGTGGSAVGAAPARPSQSGTMPLGTTAQGRPSMGDGSNRLRVPGSAE